MQAAALLAFNLLRNGNQAINVNLLIDLYLVSMLPDEKEIIRMSKFLSLVLRHQPDAIGIKLDSAGWTEVATFLRQARAAGYDLTPELLTTVVETNNKQRFSFDATGTRIRANQGHSVPINLGYPSRQPPPVLFHGTATRYLNAILAQGLEKKKRHHVHLSPDYRSALAVGRRHGKPIVLLVQAAAMHSAGHNFYLSDNGVWLTDSVPADYLKVADPE